MSRTPVVPKPRPVQSPQRREDARKSNRRLIVIVAASLLLLAALVAGALSRSSGEKSSGDSFGGGDATTIAATDDVKEMLRGIEQSGTTIGDPKAPLTLVEYADLQCPYCGQWAKEALPTLVDEYVRAGKLKIEFRGLEFVGDDSKKALRFALAASEQGQLWQVAELLYWNQGTENTGWVTDELLSSIAAALALDVAALETRAASPEITTMIAATAAQAKADAVGGTPTIFVGPTGGKLTKVELSSLGADGILPAVDAALAATVGQEG